MRANLQISIYGREIDIPIELTTDQINSICAAATSNTRVTGWEKPEEGMSAYYENALGQVQSFEINDSSKAQLETLYVGANCFSNETLANNMARGDRLIRELRRFAIKHRTKPVDHEVGYTIGYNHTNNCLEIGVSGNWTAFGDVIFETEALAREAMNIYASELIWYFTELRDTL